MRFYVNKIKQTNGDNEVHRSTCSRLPDVENRLYLGEFNTSQEAVREARKFCGQVNGCNNCCQETYTS